jgi:tetratricopeptide (TPR) repeat protein
MQASPSARYIRDRAIIFPIFSGLFLALKFGQIEQDEERRYEQNLVRRFVAETKLHGDPVHYTRALSMQAEMYGNLRDFTHAFEAFEELKKSYDAERLTADISAAYGSDRSAQCFALSALWHLQLGNLTAAEEACYYVFEHLMPKMEMKNVHNSALMLYPLIWVMKDLGKCIEILEIFVKYVVEAFDDYLGEGAFTFCLPIYDPVMMLLDLCENKDSDECEHFEDFVAWGLEEENLRFGTVINNSLGSFGRDCNSIASEICLLLAQRKEFEDDIYDAEKAETRATLVTNGLVIARESMAFTAEKKMYAAQMQIKPVLEALEELADELDIAV